MRLALLALLCGLLAGVAFHETHAEESVEQEKMVFAVLKSSRVNVRRGPSFDHAVEWVYRRRGVPVAVLDRFDHWRHIRDMDGEEGWVHFSLLDGSERGGMVRRSDNAPLALRMEAADESRIIALLQPGVVVKLLSCDAHWCRIGVGERDGWVAREGLWGIAPEDIF